MNQALRKLWSSAAELFTRHEHTPPNFDLPATAPDNLIAPKRHVKLRASEGMLRVGDVKAKAFEMPVATPDAGHMVGNYRASYAPLSSEEMAMTDKVTEDLFRRSKPVP